MDWFGVVKIFSKNIVSVMVIWILVVLVSIIFFYFPEFTKDVTFNYVSQFDLLSKVFNHEFIVLMNYLELLFLVGFSFSLHFFYHQYENTQNEVEKVLYLKYVNDVLAVISTILLIFLINSSINFLMYADNRIDDIWKWPNEAFYYIPFLSIATPPIFSIFIPFYILFRKFLQKIWFFFRSKKKNLKLEENDNNTYMEKTNNVIVVNSEQESGKRTLLKCFQENWNILENLYQKVKISILLLLILAVLLLFIDWMNITVFFPWISIDLWVQLTATFLAFYGAFYLARYQMKKASDREKKKQTLLEFGNNLLFTTFRLGHKIASPVPPSKGDGASMLCFPIERVKLNSYQYDFVKFLNQYDKELPSNLKEDLELLIDIYNDYYQFFELSIQSIIDDYKSITMNLGRKRPIHLFDAQCFYDSECVVTHFKKGNVHSFNSWIHKHPSYFFEIIPEDINDFIWYFNKYRSLEDDVSNASKYKDPMSRLRIILNRFSSVIEQYEKIKKIDFGLIHYVNNTDVKDFDMDHVLTMIKEFTRDKQVKTSMNLLEFYFQLNSEESCYLINLRDKGDFPTKENQVVLLYDDRVTSICRRIEKFLVN